MLDEIHEYIKRHEERLLKEKQRLSIISDAEYEKMIDRIKASNKRLKELIYEKDPDEAIHRLSTELSLINDLGMRNIQATLNKYKHSVDNLTDIEESTLMKFLGQIPYFNDKFIAGV